MPEERTTEDDIRHIIYVFTDEKLDKSHKYFEGVLEWIRNWPPGIDPALRNELIAVTCTAFSINKAELFSHVERVKLAPNDITNTSVQDEKCLLEIIKPSEVLTRWAQYTDELEAPLSFHIFSFLVAAGCALQKRVRFPMGDAFSYWPNMAIMMMGDSGTKKTTAAKLPGKLVRECAFMPVVTGKVTPEAFFEALAESPLQLIYAPEFSTTFNKRSYNEGFVQDILDILDCPDTKEVRTLARGLEVVYGPVVSILGGSTMSLLQTSTPAEILQSGFLNRHLVINEEHSHREFPIPRTPSKREFEYFKKRLRDMSVIEGIAGLDLETHHYHVDWYHRYKARLRILDKNQSLLIQRSQSHLIKIAMILQALEHRSKTINIETFKVAEGLITYCEEKASKTVKVLEKSTAGTELDYVVDIMRRNDGMIGHSDLLRKVSGKGINAANLQKIIRTLKEGDQVQESKKGGGAKFYLLKEVEG